MQFDWTVLDTEEVVTQLQDRIAQLEALYGTATAAAAAPAPQPSRPYGIDTRTLGKPELYSLDERKWVDWTIVMRAYAGLVNPVITKGLNICEMNVEESVLNADQTSAEFKAASTQMYHMLVMLCRGESLTIVSNSGVGAGFLAWRRLIDRYEPGVRTRMALMLVALLKWGFSGDIQAKLELFERERSSGMSIEARRLCRQTLGLASC